MRERSQLRCVEGERMEHTRVVCSTFPSRGKSLTPESRMEMLEDRSALVERSEDTHDASEFVIIDFP